MRAWLLRYSATYGASVIHKGAIRNQEAGQGISAITLLDIHRSASWYRTAFETRVAPLDNCIACMYTQSRNMQSRVHTLLGTALHFECLRGPAWYVSVQATQVSPRLSHSPAHAPLLPVTA